MFKNLKLGKKIGLGFGLVIVVGLAVSATTLWKLRAVAQVTEELTTAEMPAVKQAADIPRAYAMCMLASRSYGLSGNLKYAEDLRTAMASVRKELGECNALAEGSAVLAAYRQRAKEIEEGLQRFEKAMSLTVECNEKASQQRGVLEASAKKFAEQCAAFQGAQDRPVAEAASPSSRPATDSAGASPNNQLKRTELFNQVVALGNRAQVMTWKAIAERSAKLIEEARSDQTAAVAKVNELTTISNRNTDKPILAEIRGAMETYGTALGTIADSWKQADGLGAQRLEAANNVLALTQQMNEETVALAEKGAARSQSDISRAWMTTLTGQGAAVVISLVLAWIISRAIVGPLRKGVDFAKLVASGDFTRKLDINRGDEVGQLAGALNGMVDDLGQVMRNLTQNASTLSGSATELSATATQLAGGAEETTSQSATVASAAEEMTTNMGTMAASAEQMSANVKTVSAAVEEMTASIGEVARNAEQAASVADNAAHLAEVGNQRISELGTAADEIGKVIEVIQDIAEQTNLLALNATIEAARAGEAGKGFAVVATEVKELAKQTAEATEDISKRIQAMQSATGQAVKAINEIGGVIKSVNQVSRTIASAVEEQSITTREIAQNVAQTAAASQTVSTGVSQSAAASQEITKNISGVDTAARQTAQGAAQTQTAGQELSRLAEQLMSMVGRFRV